MKLRKHIIDGKQLLFDATHDFCEWRVKTLLTKEPYTIEWMSTFKDTDVFWDVGANIGLYSIYAAGIVGVKKVFSFEPESQNYQQLNQNIHLNKLSHSIKAYCIGIGDRNGMDTLALSQFGFGRSGHTLGKVRDDTFTQGSVSYSIDTLVDIGMPAPTHLKIDIDGLEPLVIKGATKTLPNIQTILIELSHRNKQHVQLIENIMSYGYKYNQAQVDKTSRPPGSGFESYHEYMFYR